MVTSHKEAENCSGYPKLLIDRFFVFYFVRISGLYLFLLLAAVR
jgi:hypothetical protein